MEHISNLESPKITFLGSNSGIGKVTAHELSKKGAKLIMLCRNVESANACAREITKDTGHQVEVMKLNLASLDSIRECANTLLQQEDKIDILINNAGNELSKKRQITSKIIIHTGRTYISI